MAHLAGFEPATIRLEGRAGASLDAAYYKDLRKNVNRSNTKMTLSPIAEANSA